MPDKFPHPARIFKCPLWCLSIIFLRSRVIVDQRLDRSLAQSTTWERQCWAIQQNLGPLTWTLIGSIFASDG